MIMGLGVDIINIERIEKIIKRWDKKFLNRIFTPGEINYCGQCSNSAQHFAARFAAKEAVYKALGTGKHNLSWQDVEIVNNTWGKPEVRLSGRAKIPVRRRAITKIHISLSHEKTYAIAQAIVEGGNTDDCTATG